MRKTFVVILFSLTFLKANAQDSTKTVSRLKWSNVYFMLEREYTEPMYDMGFDVQDPGLVLFVNSHEEFLKKFQADRANFTITALAGFQIRNKEKTGYRKSSLLRAGISYTSIMQGSTSDASSRFFRLDTLYDSSGNFAWVDSVVTTHRLYEEYKEKISLDFSYIFSTNPDKRVTFYEGIGVTMGLGFNNRSKLVTANDSHIWTRSQTGEQTFTNLSNFDYSDHNTTYLENKMTFTGNIYVPLGIDFRLGNKENFLKHLHLFYELRVEVAYLDEYGYFDIGGPIQHKFGIRYKW